MSDTSNAGGSNNNGNKVTGASLIASVENDLRKAATESVKNKLKDLVKKKIDAQRVVDGIDLEIQRLVEDFESGRL